MHSPAGEVDDPIEPASSSPAAARDHDVGSEEGLTKDTQVADFMENEAVVLGSGQWTAHMGGVKKIVACKNCHHPVLIGCSVVVEMMGIQSEGGSSHTLSRNPSMRSDGVPQIPNTRPAEDEENVSEKGSSSSVATTVPAPELLAASPKSVKARPAAPKSLFEAAPSPKKQKRSAEQQRYLEEMLTKIEGMKKPELKELLLKINMTTTGDLAALKHRASAFYRTMA